MTEHVHEWEMFFDIEDCRQVVIALCADQNCSSELSWDEINMRLNATERLSAEVARKSSGSVMCHQHDRCAYQSEIDEVQIEIDALEAYADLLEGKDDQNAPQG